jgi:uncharacterized protein YyaL (SSP411 family)
LAVSRLTAQDSFNNPTVAGFINENYVPIIIDKDERPDLDKIYQGYSNSFGEGGWPLHVFLTPDLLPVFVGTYWPGPGNENGEEVNFLTRIQVVQELWTGQEQQLRAEARDVLPNLAKICEQGVRGVRGEPSNLSVQECIEDGTSDVRLVSDVDIDLLEEANEMMARNFDMQNGGFDIPKLDVNMQNLQQPKFPLPTKLSFLLRLQRFPQEVADVVDPKTVHFAGEFAMLTLQKLRDGGLRDHIGGGFFRCSQTSDWSLPRFDKVVADNALLLNVFLDAWLSFKTENSPRAKDVFGDVVLELADFLSSSPVKMGSTPEQRNGFATSVDSDSYYRAVDDEMREGAYYTWTRRELETVCGRDDDDMMKSVAVAYFNVLEDGNVDRGQDPNDEFLNQNVLQIVKTPRELSQSIGVPEDDVVSMIELAKSRLRTHRQEERVSPAVDEKVIVSTNGMVISALARVSSAVGEINAEKAGLYREAATEAAKYIKERLWDGESQTLYRMGHLDQRGSQRAFAEDYAFLIEGLLDLAESWRDAGETEDWASWARTLQDRQIALFYDSTPNRSQLESRPQDTKQAESNQESFPLTNGITQSPPLNISEHSQSGGFYTSEAATPQVILRLKDGMDGERPSTNAITVLNLFRLERLVGEKKYGMYARETINAFEPELLQHPFLYPSMMAGIVAARLGTEWRGL